MGKRHMNNAFLDFTAIDALPLSI